LIRKASGTGVAQNGTDLWLKQFLEISGMTNRIMQGRCALEQYYRHSTTDRDITGDLVGRFYH